MSSGGTPSQRRLRRILQAERDLELPLPEFEVDPNRTLTDADLNALSDKVVEKMETKFYTKLGKAVWGVILGVLLVLVGWERLGPK